MVYERMIQRRPQSHVDDDVSREYCENEAMVIEKGQSSYILCKVFEVFGPISQILFQPGIEVNHYV